MQGCFWQRLSVPQMLQVLDPSPKYFVDGGSNSLIATVHPLIALPLTRLGALKGETPHCFLFYSFGNRRRHSSTRTLVSLAGFAFLHRRWQTLQDREDFWSLGKSALLILKIYTTSAERL